MTRPWNGFTVTLHDRFAKVGEALLAVMDRVEDQPGVTVIKKNMVRTVYRLEVEGTDLFLKKYHSRGAVEVVKSLVRPSRAAAEWDAMNRLNAAGRELTCRGVLLK